MIVTPARAKDPQRTAAAGGPTNSMCFVFQRVTAAAASGSRSLLPELAIDHIAVGSAHAIRRSRSNAKEEQ